MTTAKNRIKFSISAIREDSVPGQRPTWRFLTKDAGGQFHELGAAWATSKADVFSVALDLEGTGEKIKFLMVKADRPNQKPPSAPGERPAA